jgi:hypothetical protein
MLDAMSHWLDVMLAAVGTFIAAGVGLAMKYAHKVQRGEKVDLSRLWLDGPMIIFSGWCGLAVHDYFGVPDAVAYITAGLVTYLGEKSITIIVDILKGRAGGDDGDK